jgi:hypothetical protein
MKFIGLVLAILVIPAIIFADFEFDEDALFADSETLIESDTLVDDTILHAEDKESVSFAGYIVGRGGYSMTRDWVSGEATGDSNFVDIRFEGDILLDVRLRRGIRAFADLGILYSPTMRSDYSAILGNPAFLAMFGGDKDLLEETIKQYTDDSTQIVLKEFFIDANISRIVYFRGGKQTLKWGRGYFWTPTDLINVEKKQFLDMDRLREGTPGLKIHIPYQTVFNFYGFVDATDVEKLNDFALAGKLEFVIGRTEFAFSGWAKQDFLPVYGFDFSSRIGKFDIRGEASFSYGENRKRLGEPEIVFGVTNYTVTQTFDEWIPRVSIGFSRSFNWEIDDRITLAGEFFYNHSGYTENVFDDEAKRNALFFNGLYEPNYHAMYYASLFASMKRFFIQDLTFNLNALGNFNDYSFILSAGLNYNPVYNFDIAFNVVGFLGEENCEFTLSGNSIALELVTTMRF